MLVIRVEDLIEDYMNHYDASFEEAKRIMIGDLEQAKSEDYE